MHGNNFDQSHLAVACEAQTHFRSCVRACCRLRDDYSKHNSPQLFRLFSRFPSSIRQEIPLLVYLDPLDCIDPRIFEVSWFLVFIFIVLCSTFQYQAAHFGFFEWYNLKWDSFACPCLDWSTFHKTLKKRHWSSIRPLAPVFELFSI